MSPNKQSLEALIGTGLVDGSYRVERLIGEGGMGHGVFCQAASVLRR
jgi:hypothetical protein